LIELLKKAEGKKADAVAALMENCLNSGVISEADKKRLKEALDVHTKAKGNPFENKDGF